MAESHGSLFLRETAGLPGKVTRFVVLGLKFRVEEEIPILFLLTETFEWFLRSFRLRGGPDLGTGRGRRKAMQEKWLKILLMLLLACGWGTQVLAEDVGNFSRVVNEVDQLKKGKEPAVPAKVPNGVENQDVVLTKQDAMAVVQFVDESTITISPKSKVTIEDYMYDASKGKARGTIKVLEGVVETVIPATDTLQKKDIQIRTTTAIAGIRG